ncbi:antibiotic biosynthesis monooxygenase [Paenibacillus sp. MWE-103]|uniref:Antibiotic biosynthesis monooxygenase n=1 Tax=Paenibacillus artemisiicola TaxID=1172618 RepID=A0ABS3W8J3_9BACL|nr:antibiotic biosynthesis monooxygenase [Paenibacillus artemisiicola]MBO7744506.1 antibiotic biosynthesis monooxygenase [Paenibacillus artemisiicola]
MILVENRIEVKKGFGEGVMERFRQPKMVHTFPGFVRMDVLYSVNEAGNDEIRVCTTWENEDSFQAWASSQAFRGAHGRRDEESARSAGETPSGQARGGSPQANEGGPVIGNKVTIYQVFVSHLPESAAPAEQA